MRLLLLSLLVLVTRISFASEKADTLYLVISIDSVSGTDDHQTVTHVKSDWRVKVADVLKKRLGTNKRTVAAICAFPLFGWSGLHRIYLGTQPYVPVVYVATLGGCAGILPFIDFWTILLSDKETFETYKNNPRVFMWAK